jgi:AraC family transcriptional activator of mtrCDE
MGQATDANWISEIASNAAALCRTRTSAPWGMSIATNDGVMFHYVIEGFCWLRGSAVPTLELQAGDLVLVPQGLDHDILSSLDAAAEPLEDFLHCPSRPITGELVSTLLCGVYLSGIKMVHPILSALPPAIHFRRAEIEKHPSLSATLRQLTAESEAPGPGSETLIQHLFDALFVYIVRTWSAAISDNLPGWAAALRDPSLSRAVTAIHASPGRPWTVQTLAAEARQSRAAFARHFTAKMGEAPLAYLTRWRMILAARLLLGREISLAEVAEYVGYESEFAFSRAFKRTYGIAPASYRKTCLRDLYLTR